MSEKTEQKQSGSIFGNLFGKPAAVDEADPNDQYFAYVNKDKFVDLVDNPEILSSRAKKWKQFKSKSQELGANFIQGAIMGGLVGGMFGAVLGVYTAVTSRRVIMIPLMAVASGMSFGFIMGCGSLIRTTDQFPIDYVEGEWRTAFEHNQRNNVDKFV